MLRCSHAPWTLVWAALLVSPVLGAEVYTGFVFVMTAPSTIENNVTVACKAPWTYREVKDGKIVPGSESLASGKNVAYDADLGFVDVASPEFHLKPGSRLMQDLTGFEPIPVEMIGLHIDEYRRTLPTNDEIDHFRKRAAHGETGYEIQYRN